MVLWTKFNHCLINSSQSIVLNLKIEWVTLCFLLSSFRRHRDMVMGLCVHWVLVKIWMRLLIRCIYTIYVVRIKWLRLLDTNQLIGPREMWFQTCNFQSFFIDWYLQLKILPSGGGGGGGGGLLMTSQHRFNNGLVPSDKGPLPEPMWTQFYFAIWRHLVTMN